MIAFVENFFFLTIGKAVTGIIAITHDSKMLKAADEIVEVKKVSLV